MNQKELLEKKNDLVTRAEETLNKAKAENRELTDAEMAELAEIRDNVRKIVVKSQPLLVALMMVKKMAKNQKKK